MTQDRIKTIKEISYDYFRGTIAPEDTARLDIFLKDGKNAEQFREWEKEWENTETPTYSQIVSFSRLSRRLHRSSVRKATYIGAAAAVAMAVAAILFTVNRPAPAAQEPKMHIVESGLKENTKVTLPDGTMVWLNSASRIMYSDSFSKDNRQVDLYGEAYFDVTKDERHPFTVRMGSSSITVKGTRFDVCAYEKESRVYAALLEGSIVFNTDCATMDIIPGEVVTFSKEDKSITKAPADVESWTSWMKGSINLCSVTYKDLFTRLSTVYGKEILFEPNKHSDKTINVVLNSSESLENVLDALCVLAPLEWTGSTDGAITVCETE